MKTTSRLLALCGSIAFVASAHATLNDYDPFDYTGTDLAGQNRTTGFNGPWFTTSSSMSNSLSNDGISLSYPVPFESPLTTPASAGSHIKTGGLPNNASTSRMLSQTVPLNVDGTVRYASALFRKNTPTGATNNDNVIIEFVDAAGNRRWGFGIEGTADKPWLNANGSTNLAGPAVTAGDTYLIVTKIVSSAASLDTAYLKVYGTGYGTQFPVAEPTTWDATLTETTSAVLDRLRVRIDPGNGPATPGEVDDIRVGTSWQDVVTVLNPITDTNPPVVISASSLLTNTVNVIFSEPVSQATATNPANYTLLGNTFSSITQPAGTNVQIIVNTPITGNYTIAISNVQDIAGNTMAGTNVSGFAHLWEGAAAISITNGMAYALNKKVAIFADGANIFNAEDHCEYVAKIVSGDFDLAVRVEFLLRTDNNARAGLMARMNTNSDSPNVLIEATPDRFILQYRTNPSDTTVALASPRPPTAFPNCWVRLVRSGAVFTGYSSTNFGSWDLIGSFDTSVGSVAYSNDILIGLVASAGNAANTTSALFSGFGPSIVAPTLAIVPSGTQLEISWLDAKPTFGFILESTPGLTSPLTWTTVPNSDTTNRVLVPISSGPLFYRARYPISP